MSDCLHKCRTLQRKVTRFAPPFDSSFAKPSLCQMVCDNLWLSLCAFWELILYGYGDRYL